MVKKSAKPKTKPKPMPPKDMPKKPMAKKDMMMPMKKKGR